MTIGLDIDNTLVNTKEAMYKFIYEDDRKEELLDNINHLTSGNTKNEMVKYFYKKYALKIFESAKLMEGAKDAINFLIYNNHKIVFITLRGDKDKLYHGSRDLTNYYMSKYNIPYSKIIFDSKDKTSICKQENIDILLDDSIRVISKLRNIKTRGILFNTVNKPNYGCEQVTSWYEFIDKIKEIS